MSRTTAPPTAPPIIATELLLFLLPDKSCTVNVPVVFAVVSGVFKDDVDDFMGHVIAFKLSPFPLESPDPVVDWSKITNVVYDLHLDIYICNYKYT